MATNDPRTEPRIYGILGGWTPPDKSTLWECICPWGEFPTFLQVLDSILISENRSFARGGIASVIISRPHSAASNSWMAALQQLFDQVARLFSTQQPAPEAMRDAAVDAERCDPDEMQRWPLSPLHAAVDVGDLPSVRALVAAGANIEERDMYRHHPLTPLLRAADEGHVAVARYLVERGADKEALTLYGDTSLHITAQKGHVGVMRVLIEHGANKDAAGDMGFTPLIWGSIRGYVAIVECLLEHGCNIDHAGADGYTALHEAALHNKLEIVQLLLRFGARLDVRDIYGQTPADVATECGHHDIADAIRAEEIRRRDHGFKRDRSTIVGTEEYEASRRPLAERKAAEAAAAAAAAAVDESDDDDDDDDEDGDDEEEG